MKKHGFLWWVFIGWWWWPVRLVCYDLPKLLIKGITQPSKQSAQPAPKSEPRVLVTSGGKRFHMSPDCPSIRSARTTGLPISKARAAGYTACDKCCMEYIVK